MTKHKREYDIEFYNSQNKFTLKTLNAKSVKDAINQLRKKYAVKKLVGAYKYRR